MIDPADLARQFLLAADGWKVVGQRRPGHEFVIALSKLIDARDAQHAEERARQARQLTDLHMTEQAKLEDSIKVRIEEARAMEKSQLIHQGREEVLDKLRDVFDELGG